MDIEQMRELRTEGIVQDAEDQVGRWIESIPGLVEGGKAPEIDRMYFAAVLSSMARRYLDSAEVDARAELDERWTN